MFCEICHVRMKKNNFYNSDNDLNIVEYTCPICNSHIVTEDGEY
jgi:hypothetical protein